MSEPLTDKQLKETGRRLRDQWMINTAAAGELLEEVYRLRAEHEWIKTSEQEPVPYQHCWVYVAGTERRVMGPGFVSEDGSEWLFELGRAHIGKAFGIYWTPFYTPEPPEEAK